jgi:hypothetical protein
VIGTERSVDRRPVARTTAVTIVLVIDHASPTATIPKLGNSRALPTSVPTAIDACTSRIAAPCPVTRATAR